MHLSVTCFFPQEAIRYPRIETQPYFILFLAFPPYASQSNFKQILDSLLKLCLSTVYFTISTLWQI